MGPLAKIGESLGLDVYLNFMVTETGDALQLVSCAGIPEETARSISRLEFGQAVCGTVALHRTPIVATRIQGSGEPMVQVVKGFGIRAYACNPLLARGRLLGTLSFASRTRDHFEPEEIEFLETISQYVTVVYERLRLMAQLRAQDRRKDEFLATLAHELRNPLAPLRTAAALVQHTNPPDPDAQWGLDVIDRQVRHLTRLVDDLLDLSRITRDVLDLHRERLDLAEVLEAAVETSRPLIRIAAALDKRVEIRFLSAKRKFKPA